MERTEMSETKINDGGPAFPHPGTPVQDGQMQVYPELGLSLRDYFAAAALTGLLHPGWGANADAAPAEAYRLADLMLAARARGEG
jgi:hypothetical protein